MFYIRQIEKQDCGFACLKMLLANLYKDKNYLFLKQEVNHGPYSFKELVDVAAQHSLTLQGYDFESKSEILDHGDKTPFLASIKNLETRHMVLVYKIDKRKVYVLDPQNGRMEYRHGDFIDIFDGKILKVERYIASPCAEKPKSFMPKIDLILSCVLRALCFAAVFVGIFLLNKNNSYIYPLIFISFSFVFEILYRSLNIKICKKLDDKVNYYNRELKEDGWRNYFSAFERSKSIVTSFPGTIIFSLVLSVFIIVITILNSKYNIIPCLIAIILALVEIGFIRPGLRKRKLEIANLEEGLYKSKSGNTRKEYVNLVHEKSYKYAYISMSSYFVSLFVIFVSTFLSMILNDAMNLTYIIFYGFIFSYLKTTLCDLFTLNEKYDDLNYYRCLMINLGEEKNY